MPTIARIPLWTAIDGGDDYETANADVADATLLDGTADSDGGLTNAEVIAGTDPSTEDSDNDGLSDALELANNMNPTNGGCST